MLKRLTRKQTLPTADSLIQNYIQQIYQSQCNQIRDARILRKHRVKYSYRALIKSWRQSTCILTIISWILALAQAKLCLHFFLRTCVRASSGIEIVTNQFDSAMAVAARVRHDIPGNVSS